MEETASLADCRAPNGRAEDLLEQDPLPPDLLAPNLLEQDAFARNDQLSQTAPAPRPRSTDPRAQDWQSRVIVGSRLGLDAVPAWMQQAWESLCENLGSEAYPCFYGTQAFRANAIYFSLVEGGCARHLPDALRHFLRHCRDHALANFAVIFEPDATLDHEATGRRFWSVLQFLQSRDPSSILALDEPDDPLWEFTFDGVPMFVVGASPTYAQRRSRNLGACMIMLFQPRSVFETGQENGSIGHAQRASIRRRLRAWDGIPHHPSLGVYGDSDNREWQQYFLPDDNADVTGTCPLRRQ